MLIAKSGPDSLPRHLKSDPSYIAFLFANSLKHFFSVFT